MEVAYFDVALGSEVVDLGRLDFVNDLHEAGTVSEVTIVQLHVFRVQNIALDRRKQYTPRFVKYQH